MKKGKSKTSKITINVWRSVWSKLEKRLETACLKRDAYIGMLINWELDRLEAEMPIANSEAAEQFIEKQLRALLHQNYTPLSIALAPEVAKKLERVCKEKRIVRDSFFNRLFLFLAFGPKLAGMLLFRGLDSEDEKWTVDSWTRTVWREYQHEDQFFQSVFDPFLAGQDPLWPIRACFEIIEERDRPEYVEQIDPESQKVVKMVKWVPEQFLRLPYRFYTTVFTDHDLRKGASTRHAAQGHGDSANAERGYHNLYGLNCYLPNFHVLGHPDQKVADEALFDL